jgi:hypothetical protein
MLFFVSFNFSSNKFKFILYLFSINLGESKLHKRQLKFISDLTYFGLIVDIWFDAK